MQNLKKVEVKLVFWATDRKGGLYQLHKKDLIYCSKIRKIKCVININCVILERFGSSIGFQIISIVSKQLCVPDPTNCDPQRTRVRKQTDDPGPGSEIFSGPGQPFPEWHNLTELWSPKFGPT